MARISASHLLQLAKLHYRRFKLSQRAAGLLIFFVVGNDLGKPKLCGQFVVALLHLFQTIDHGKLHPPSKAGLQCFLGNESQKGGKEA
jgi:hypothetical protein